MKKNNLVKKTINQYFYEKKYQKLGYKLIGGIDEVGRGCWAGPVTCALVIFPIDYHNDAIHDSKTLSKKKRQDLANIIKKDALAYQIEFLPATLIDKMNIKQATIYCMQKCVKNICLKPDFILIDFEKIICKIPSYSFPKGDQKSITIAAASILAKVARDEYMDKIDHFYPQYNFKLHKGYGTKNHLSNLQKYGPIKTIHRFSFKPVFNLLNKTKEKNKLMIKN